MPEATRHSNTAKWSTKTKTRYRSCTPVPWQEQLNGDSSTSVGANTNDENQKGGQRRPCLRSARRGSRRIEYPVSDKIPSRSMLKNTGGTCPKTWSAGPLVRPELDSRSMGRCPWLQLETTAPELLLQNKHPTREEETQKSRSAETARLAWVPTETGRTKGQLSGDSSTGLGLNRNGENQRAAQRRLLDWSWSQQKR